jgi:hypothetical protein
VSIGTVNATATEIKLPTLVNHSTTTGTFIVNATTASTLLVPVFPIVGALGNPMIGYLVGKVNDWTNATQFAFTMYNTSHNYIMFSNTNGNTFGSGGGITYDATPTCSLAIRYE